MRVLLVDGVGNGAIYERSVDCLTITLRRPRGDASFLKTAEPPHDGLPIYRQAWQQKTTAAEIRHINAKIT